MVPSRWALVPLEDWRMVPKDTWLTRGYDLSMTSKNTTATLVESKSCTSLCMSNHYCDAIMGTVASQITRLTIVYTTVYSDADQSKHQSSASLAFVWGIHRGPVNSPHKWPVTRKMFPLMTSSWTAYALIAFLYPFYGGFYRYATLHLT